MSDEIFEHAPIGLAEVLDGRLVRANRAFAALLASTPEALAGCPLADAFGTVDADFETQLLASGAGGEVRLARRRDDGRQLSAQARRLADGRLVVSLHPLPDDPDAARRIRHLHVLWELGRAVAAQPDVSKLLVQVAEAAREMGPAHEIRVLMPPEFGDQPALVVRARTQDRLPPAPGLDELVLELGERAMRQRSAQGQRLGDDGPWIAAVPIRAGERSLGAVVALRAAAEPDSFSTAELQRIRTVADFGAFGAQSANFLAEQQRRVRDLVLLNEVASDCGELGLDRLLPAVTQRICRALSMSLGALLFLDGDELVMGSLSTSGGSVVGPRARAQVNAGLCLRALASRQPRRGRAELLGLPDFAPLVQELGADHGAAVPLLVKDRAIGVVVVARADRAIEDEEARLLAAICAEVAVAVENATLFAETKRRASQLEAVRSMGEVVSRSLESQPLLEEASARLCSVFDAEMVRVYLRRGDEHRLVYARGLTREPGADDAPNPECLLELERAVASGVTIELSPDVCDHDPCRRAGLVTPGRWALAPLRGGAEAVRGLLFVGRESNRGFSRSDLELLGTLGGQLAMALQNASLYEETRSRVEDLAIVAEAGRALVGAAPLEDALDMVAERLARLAGVRDCVILLLDEKEQELRGVAGSPLARDKARPLRMGLDAMPASRVVLERRVLRAPGDIPASSLDRLPFGWQSACALPLLAGHRVVGVVALGDPMLDRALSADEVERAMAIGTQVASAIERARLNAELEHSQEQLVRRERLAALGELAALVAHEVRNPLGVIYSSLGSLRKLVPLEGDARRLYDMLQEEAGRLNRIVSEMLDYTRPLDPRLRPAVLERVLRDAAESAAATERARGTPLDEVSTTLELEPALPPVPLDEGLVHQAVVNLLSNAYQSLRGRGHVHIRAALHRERTQAFARIAIHDDGPGIAPDLVPRLFEPFVTTKATGSGLGLAVVRRIAEGHRGNVSVQTEPGRGTTFLLDLPLERGTAEIAATGAPEASAGSVS